MSERLIVLVVVRDSFVGEIVSDKLIVCEDVFVTFVLLSTASCSSCALTTGLKRLFADKEAESKTRSSSSGITTIVVETTVDDIIILVKEEVL